MDSRKIGGLIRSLRLEKGLTQKNIADSMHLSDKTLSKWERGIGCPDISLIDRLSAILGTNIGNLLRGDLDEKSTDGGNMKRIQFHVCKSCGNILTSTSPAELACCGRRLEPLPECPEDETHRFVLEDLDDEYYVTLDHPMRKDHYLSFAALVGYDRVTLVRMYPEQDAALRLPRMQRGKLYIYCSEHGLFARKL